MQSVEIAIGTPARVIVVPAAGVEGMSPEIADSGNAWKLRPVQRPVGHGDEACPNPVIAIGRDDPARDFRIPTHLGDFGLEQGAVVKVVVVPDGGAVVENLTRVRVFLRRDIVELFEQRQIDVGFDVALGAGVAIPIPRAAEITASLYDANVFDARVAQSCAGLQTAESTTYHHHVDLVGHRLALDCGLDIGVV